LNEAVIQDGTTILFIVARLQMLGMKLAHGVIKVMLKHFCYRQDQ
jgi:hypothetical protein